MTKKLFWVDPYQCELETKIASANGPQITLEETIFYAFSGGQESDSGTIGGHKVLEAKKDGLNIFYLLPEAHGLKIGDSVKVQIDWTRRYQLMRLHFAAELVLEHVCQRFPEVVKIGAHIAQDKARIDFAWDQNITPHIPLLQKEVQAIIDSNQEITSAFRDEKNEIRYWKIREFAEVPCGGTHIRRTGEVGPLSLKRANPGKGKERIEIRVGKTD